MTNQEYKSAPQAHSEALVEKVAIAMWLKVLRQTPDDVARYWNERLAQGAKESFLDMARAALSVLPQHPALMECVEAEIAAERRRQIEIEGWTPEHDDTHAKGEMAKAAACYAYVASMPDKVRDVALMNGLTGLDQVVVLRRVWPWEKALWKPKNRRHDLIRAAALIVAEIERLDRTALSRLAAAPSPPSHDETGWPTDAGGWASRIENYWILKDCGRRDGKSPFDLLVEDIERIQAQARRTPTDKADTP